MKIAVSAALLLSILLNCHLQADSPDTSTRSATQLSKRITQAINDKLESERSAARLRLVKRKLVEFDRFTGFRNRSTFLMTATPGRSLIPEEEEPALLGTPQEPIK